jgi:ribosomal protein S18 acetylase RimI-like enzyme
MRNLSFQSKLEALQWHVLDKSLSEELIFKQYTSTVRRMRGKKYCLLVAKDSHQGSIDDSHDFVVGVVEMGLSLCPPTTNSAGENAAELRPQPTIGVLCVNSTHRQKGIGLTLVRKCEQVAADVWNDECVFVDVDPSNLSALKFFEKCGYNSFYVDELVQMRNATLYRQRKKESKPHYLLKKILDDSSIKLSDSEN